MLYTYVRAMQEAGNVLKMKKAADYHGLTAEMTRALPQSTMLCEAECIREELLNTEGTSVEAVLDGEPHAITAVDLLEKRPRYTLPRTIGKSQKCAHT